MYEKCTTDELKDLLRKYIELRYPKIGFKEISFSSMAIFGLLLVAGSTINTLSSGITWANGFGGALGSIGVYYWHSQQQSLNFYSQQLNLIQQELDKRT